MTTFSLRRLCEILLLGLIAGLPFEYYFRSGETLLTSLKLQIGFFLSCWIGMKWVERQREGRFNASLPRRLVFALLCYLATQAAAAILAPEFQGNAGKAAAKAALGVLLAFASADLIWGSAKALAKQALAVLAITGFVVAGIGLGQLAGLDFFDRGAGVFQSQRYFIGSRMRLSSTMEYPNTAASFLASSFLASVVLLAFTSHGTRLRKDALLWILLLAAEWAALLMTYSRGAIGSLVLALAITTALFWKLAPGRYWKLSAGGSLILLLAGLPVLFFRPAVGGQPEKRSARYGLAASEEIKHLLPNREYRESLMVRNESTLPWLQNGFGVGYRWHNLGSGVSTALREAARFRDDVAVGHERILDVAFRTPQVKGEYFLVWFIFRSDPVFQEVERSFSPAVVCVIHEPGEKPFALSQKSARYLKMVQEERQVLTMTSVPARLDLWRAALQMFRSRPLLGVGPDNFRLAKWKYMNFPKGDETTLANNLYLEVLAGSGIVGFAALLWVLWEACRVLRARFGRALSTHEWAVIFFGISFFLAFLIHGLVDYFLKFTPTFALFWIMLGLLCSQEDFGDSSRL